MVNKTKLFFGTVAVLSLGAIIYDCNEARNVDSVELAEMVNELGGEVILDSNLGDLYCMSGYDMAKISYIDQNNDGQVGAYDKLVVEFEDQSWQRKVSGRYVNLDLNSIWGEEDYSVENLGVVFSGEQLKNDKQERLSEFKGILCAVNQEVIDIYKNKRY